MVTIYNDNRSEHSQVWFVIIQVINKIRQLCSRSQICLIMSIIPDQIGHDTTFCNQLIITIKNCDISSFFVDKTQYISQELFFRSKNENYSSACAQGHVLSNYSGKTQTIPMLTSEQMITWQRKCILLKTHKCGHGLGTYTFLIHQMPHPTLSVFFGVLILNLFYSHMCSVFVSTVFT